MIFLMVHYFVMRVVIYSILLCYQSRNCDIFNGFYFVIRVEIVIFLMVHYFVMRVVIYIILLCYQSRNCDIFNGALFCYESSNI